MLSVPAGQQWFWVSAGFSGTIRPRYNGIDSQHDNERIDLTAGIHFRVRKVERSWKEKQQQNKHGSPRPVLSPQASKTKNHHDRERRAEKHVRRIKRLLGEVANIETPEAGPDVKEAPRRGRYEPRRMASNEIHSPLLLPFHVRQFSKILESLPFF